MRTFNRVNWNPQGEMKNIRISEAVFKETIHKS